MVKEIIIRSKLLDESKMTPGFVDEKLPTVTVNRGSRVRGTGATITFGSHLVGSDVTWKIGRLSVATGSPEAWFEIRHSRKGTWDFVYFSAKGDEKLVSNPYREPIYNFTPGTVTVVLPAAGSAKWFSAYLEGPED